MIQLPHHAAEKAGFSFPDMTALLDVIFILLVFFLLTANAATQALTVTLPTDTLGQTQAIEVNQSITITLFADEQRWGVNQQSFNSWPQARQQLLSLLAQQPDAQIILAGDQQVSLQKLLAVFTWLQSQQLTAAQIIMRQPQE